MPIAFRARIAPLTRPKISNWKTRSRQFVFFPHQATETGAVTTAAAAGCSFALQEARRVALQSLRPCQTMEICPSAASGAVNVPSAVRSLPKTWENELLLMRGCASRGITVWSIPVQGRLFDRGYV